MFCCTLLWYLMCLLLVMVMGWKNKALLLCLMVSVGLFIMTGCGNDKMNSFRSNSGNDSVVLAAYRHLAPGEKDGFYCSKILEVWEPLITNDESTGLPKPCLAESWEMLDDGKRWLFHLKKGVKFHDESTFNAQSVIDNIERMKKGLKKSNFYNLDINNFYPGLVGVKKVDDYTVEFTFSKPNINQLYNMMNFGSAMYSPKCFDDEGNFSGFAIGTGPFYIEENKIGQIVRLKRFEKYHGEKAESEEIAIRNMPSADTRFSALKSEEIMGVLDLNAMPPALATELIKDDRFAISTSKSTMVRFLLINSTKFPFNDIRMRQALSLLLDREALTEGLYMGYAVPTINLLSNSSPFYKEYPIVHDKARAKELAQSVLQGERVTIVYCINGADPLQKGEAELIAYWLEDIGIDVEIQSLEYAVMTSLLKKGQYNIARSQQGLPNGDPQFIFNYFLLPDRGRNKSSHLGYENQQIKMLLNQLDMETRDGQRRALYNEIQDITVNDLPVVPLYYDENIVVYNKKLSGYQARTYGVTLSRIGLKQN